MRKTNRGPGPELRWKLMPRMILERRESILAGVLPVDPAQELGELTRRAEPFFGQHALDGLRGQGELTQSALQALSVDSAGGVPNCSDLGSRGHGLPTSIVDLAVLVDVEDPVDQ